MKTQNRAILVAAMVGLIPLVAFAGDVPPALSPEVLANMRGAACQAATTCGHFYDSARRLEIRNAQMGQTLAAILRLRDDARKFAESTESDNWPRPDWLRVCSENLLNRWMIVEGSFPLFEPTPPVVRWWNQAQSDLVALYRISSAYIGRPVGPLPTALAVAFGQANQPTVAQMPPPGAVPPNGPAAPGGQP